MKGRSLQRLNFAPAAEDGGRAAPQRVVLALQDFPSTIAALLEVDFQEVLQSLRVQDVWDSRQQHRPGADLRLHLEGRTPRVKPTSHCATSTRKEPITSSLLICPLMNGVTLTLCVEFCTRTSWNCLSAKAPTTVGQTDRG